MLNLCHTSTSPIQSSLLAGLRRHRQDGWLEVGSNRYQKMGYVEQDLCHWASVSCCSMNRRNHSLLRFSGMGGSLLSIQNPGSRVRLWISNWARLNKTMDDGMLVMLAGAIRKSCELWRKPGSHVATAHGLQQNHCARSVKTLKPGKTQILGHCFASKQLHFQQLLTNTQTSFLETGCQRDSGRCSVTVQIKGELKNWDLSSRFQKLPNCRYFLSWAGLLSRSKSKKSKHYDLASIRSIHFASDPSCLFLLYVWVFWSW